MAQEDLRQTRGEARSWAGRDERLGGKSGSQAGPHIEAVCWKMIGITKAELLHNLFPSKSASGSVPRKDALRWSPAEGS